MSGDQFSGSTPVLNGWTRARPAHGRGKGRSGAQWSAITITSCTSC